MGRGGTGYTRGTARTRILPRTTGRCPTTMSCDGVSARPRRGCEMGRGWSAVLEAGLGDARTRMLGAFLIVVAVVGTVLMRSYANIETVFAASLLAGSLLGRWWTILVPLTALAVLQPLEWSTTYAGYGLNAMTGITFFVISGYVFVGFLGRRIRPRVLFRVKSVALLTTISVPVTIAYDLWTAFGERYFITRPFCVGIVTILEAQVPLPLYHLRSSLTFVPLFCTTSPFLHTYGAHSRTPAAATKTPDRE